SAPSRARRLTPRKHSAISGQHSAPKQYASPTEIFATQRNRGSGGTPDFDSSFWVKIGTCCSFLDEGHALYSPLNSSVYSFPLCFKGVPFLCVSKIFRRTKHAVARLNADC